MQIRPASALSLCVGGVMNLAAVLWLQVVVVDEFEDHSAKARVMSLGDRSDHHSFAGRRSSSSPSRTPSAVNVNRPHLHFESPAFWAMIALYWDGRKSAFLLNFETRLTRSRGWAGGSLVDRHGEVYGLNDSFADLPYGRMPSAMACLGDDLEARLAHLKLPSLHQKMIRTTNLCERCFVEERRRTKVIPRFFDEKSCLKLVFATLWRASGRWRGVRFSEMEKQQLEAYIRVRRTMGKNFRSVGGRR